MPERHSGPAGPAASLRARLARLIALLILPLALAACAGERVWAPDDAVTRAAYVHDGQTELVLYTMVNNETGQGGHSGLMINGSQRVLFDPAGSWYHRTAPERNDLFYGMTPRMEEFYVAYHARETYHVVVQRIPVSRQVADMAIRLAAEAGPVPNAYCANSIARILRQLPGFEGIPQTFFPVRLSDAFAELPGVTSDRIYSDLPDDAPSVRLTAQEQRAAQLQVQ
jgi:hypothetical protein